MYADDTCLLYSHRDLNVIQNYIQEDVNNITKWAHDNGIMINIKKTKCMHLYSPYSKVVTGSPHIVGHDYDCLHIGISGLCKCGELEVVKEYRYLGLTINTNFTWKTHVQNVCEKLRAVLVKFHHLSFLTNRATLYMLYYGLVDSILSYGLSSYGRTFRTYLDKIRSLQIRFMKNMVDKSVKDKCRNNYDLLFIKCKILPVHERVSVLIALEDFVKNDFKRGTDHPLLHRKREKKVLNVPRVHNYYGERTRQYILPKLYNSLPGELRDNNVSKQTFNRKIKTHLLEKLSNEISGK